jgi:hypothetical protein
MAVDLRVRGPFPRVLDNTMVTTFIECPTRFKYRHIHHLIRGIGIDLHAGAVFAKGMEVARRAIWGPDKLSVDDALKRAFIGMAHEWGKVETDPDEVKSFPRVFGALEYYFTAAFPPVTDHIQPIIDEATGQPWVEWNGTLPLPINHPETGEPLLYTGRFDMFGRLRGERMVILDEKTAQQLGSQWNARWRLRSQFSGYVWLAREYGHMIDTALIRGIAFYKHNYGHTEAIMYRQQWHIDMWYQNLLRVVQRMVDQYNSGTFDLALGEACGAWGGCMFQDLCDTPDPNSWVSQYKVEEWNPLLRHKIPKEQQGEKVVRIAHVE